MFECLDAPPAGSAVQDQTDLALYINGLHMAYRDCKTRLKNLEPVVNGGSQ